MERDRKDRSRLEDAIREWGGRDPRTSPETAATRVVARLDVRVPTPPRWRVAVASAAVVVAAAGLWLARWDGERPPRPGSADPRTAPVTAPPLADNVVLWMLDDETPVYFVLGPPSSR